MFNVHEIDACSYIHTIHYDVTVTTGPFFLNIGLLFHCVQPVEQIHFLSLVQQSKDIYCTKINQLIYFNVSISRCLKLLTNFC